MELPTFIKTSPVVHMWIFCTYVISALIVTSCQCFTLLIWPFSREIYRTVNGHLINFMWLQLVWLVDYWSGSPVHLYTSRDMLDNVSDRHALLVVNHKQDVDWLVIWQLADRFKLMSGAKCLMKKEIKFVPFFGWSFYLTEQLFVNRNYAKDKSSLMKQLKNITTYHFPTVTLIFCEGTRYTPEKYKKSLAFAKERGLPELKHHLLPRTKGFNLCIEAFKGKVPVIYDVTIAYQDNVEPSIYDLVCGRKYDFHVYCRDIPLDEVPTDSEEATANYCYDMYKQKDAAYEYFMQHNTFSGYDATRPEHVLPPRKLPLFIMCFWLVVVGLPLMYWFLALVLLGSSTTVITIVAVITAMFVLGKALLAVTVSSKGSTYGSSKDRRNQVGAGGDVHTNGTGTAREEKDK